MDISSLWRTKSFKMESTRMSDQYLPGQEELELRAEQADAPDDDLDLDLDLDDEDDDEDEVDLFGDDRPSDAADEDQDE